MHLTLAPLSLPSDHFPCLPVPLCTQVAVQHSSCRLTLGRVTGACPGWVRVEVEAGGAMKDVPEGDAYRLLADLLLI